MYNVIEKYNMYTNLKHVLYFNIKISNLCRWSNFNYAERENHISIEKSWDTLEYSENNFFNICSLFPGSPMIIYLSTNLLLFN